MYTDEITSVHRRATLNDIATGMMWYPEANAIARECSDVRMGAGIISALSPRNPWHRNVALARLAFVGVLSGGTLGDSVRKANLIRSGIDPLDALGKGRKTLSFFDNILNPFTSTAVTIDVHAMRVAGIVDRDAPTVRQYRELSDAYSQVAADNNMRPLELQAITWCVYRREQNLWTHRKDNVAS